MGSWLAAMVSGAGNAQAHALVDQILILDPVAVGSQDAPIEPRIAIEPLGQCREVVVLLDDIPPAAGPPLPLVLAAASAVPAEFRSPASRRLQPATTASPGCGLAGRGPAAPAAPATAPAARSWPLARPAWRLALVSRVWPEPQAGPQSAASRLGGLGGRRVTTGGLGVSTATLGPLEAPRKRRWGRTDHGRRRNGRYRHLRRFGLGDHLGRLDGRRVATVGEATVGEVTTGGGVMDGAGTDGTVTGGAGAATFGISTLGISTFGISTLGSSTFGASILGISTLGGSTLAITSAGLDGTEGGAGVGMVGGATVTFGVSTLGSRRRRGACSAARLSPSESRPWARPATASLARWERRRPGSIAPLPASGRISVPAPCDPRACRQ